MKYQILFLLGLTLSFVQAKEIQHSPKDMGNAFNVSEVLNVSYDSEETYRLLDLYLPEGTTNFPVLVWIHGGAWAFGSKADERNLAHNFASKGIAVAVVDFRQSPAVWRDPKLNTGIKHPGHLEDISLAFKWVSEHAASYNYDKSSIFVGGFSSGAHLVSLLSLDKTYLKNVGTSTNAIRGCIAIGGTYDLNDYFNTIKGSRGEVFAKQHVHGVFGNQPDNLINASPVSYLTNQQVPILVIADSQSKSYTQVFENAAREANYAKIDFLYDSKSHSELYGDLAQNENSTLVAKILSFIKVNKNKHE